MDDIKQILNKGLRFGAVRLLHPKQLAEAANELIQAGIVSREILEQMGRNMAGDSLLFKDVNVDQMNKVLQKLRKQEVVTAYTIGNAPCP